MEWNPNFKFFSKTEGIRGVPQKESERNNTTYNPATTLDQEEKKGHQPGEAERACALLRPLRYADGHTKKCATQIDADRSD